MDPNCSKSGHPLHRGMPCVVKLHLEKIRLISRNAKVLRVRPRKEELESSPKAPCSHMTVTRLAGSEQTRAACNNTMITGIEQWWQREIEQEGQAHDDFLFRVNCFEDEDGSPLEVLAHREGCIVAEG